MNLNKQDKGTVKEGLHIMLEELSRKYQSLPECADKTSPQQDRTLRDEQENVRGLRSPKAQGHYGSQMASQDSTAPGDTTELQLKVKVPVISQQIKKKCGISQICESGNRVEEFRLLSVNIKKNPGECLQIYQFVNV